MTPGSADDAWAPPPTVALTPATAISVPGYDDFRPIARGGSSDVFSAVQITTRRPVAVKVVHLRDPEAIRHFERELEITVRLGRQHPNIVTVLDTAVTSDGLPCLVMELADLGSVDARLRELGPLPVGDVVALGTVIADALAFAHQQGVLHRDIKPPNILVLPTSYVLSDFGIARTLDAGHSASMELFSYRHAAPQVLDGEMPAAADDVYSLGSTMFTLLEGHAPFAGATPEEDSALSYLRRSRTTAAPALARPGVPAQLTGIIARCLSRERADRPSASELHEQLLGVPTELRGWAGRAMPTEALAAAAFPPPPTAPPPMAAPVSEPRLFAAPQLPLPAPIPLLTPAASLPPPAASLSPEREALLAATAQSFGVRVEEFAPDQTVGMRAEAPRPPEAARRNRRAWLPWVVAITLLVAGVAALFLTHRGSSKAPVAGRPIAPSTAPTAPTAPTAATSQPARPSPSAAASGPAPMQPDLVSVKPDGAKVRLHWTDPSGGVDTFVVAQLVDGSYQTFPAYSQGVTMVTLTPHAQPHNCFQVVALNRAGMTASNQLCSS